MTKDNHLLGKFDLFDIPAAPRGVPQIEVSFEIDVNGILTVSAVDKGTGNEKNVVIQGDRLSSEDIEKMVAEAEQFAEDDRRVADRLKTRNELESHVYSLKKQIGDRDKLSAQLSDEEIEIVERAINEQIDWLDGNPDAGMEEIQQHKSEFESVVHPIISKIYDKTAEQDSEGDRVEL